MLTVKHDYQSLPLQRLDEIEGTFSTIIKAVKHCNEKLVEQSKTATALSVNALYKVIVEIPARNNFSKREKQSYLEFWNLTFEIIKQTVYCMIGRDNRSLEGLQLPGFSCYLHNSICFRGGSSWACYNQHCTILSLPRRLLVTSQTGNNIVTLCKVLHIVSWLTDICWIVTFGSVDCKFNFPCFRIKSGLSLSRYYNAFYLHNVNIS